MDVGIYVTVEIKKRMLLDSGCSYALVMKRLTANLYPKTYDVMQWHTQAGNITIILRVKRYYILPELSATKIVM